MGCIFPSGHAADKYREKWWFFCFFGAAYHGHQQDLAPNCLLIWIVQTMHNSKINRKQGAIRLLFLLFSWFSYLCQNPMFCKQIWPIALVSHSGCFRLPTRVSADKWGLILLKTCSYARNPAITYQDLSHSLINCQKSLSFS